MNGLPAPRVEDVPSDLVALGSIRGAYGLKGWARIVPFAQDGAVLEEVRQWWLIGNGAAVALQVAQVKRHGAQLLAKWFGAETPEAVDALKGLQIAVQRALFPAPESYEFYAVDLVGSTVINRADETLGTVSGISETGGQSLLEVAAASGSILIPLVDLYVEEVNVGAKQVRVDWQADW